MARCDGCGAHIIWVKTDKGKNMPIDAKPAMLCGITVKTQTDIFDHTFATVHPVVYRSHFETCPEADRFREDED